MLDSWLTDIKDWLGEHLWPIAIIILTSYIFYYFGERTIDIVTRRLVSKRLHGDQSEEDIKKRQNTLIGIFSIIFRILVWLVAVYGIFKHLEIDLSPALAAIALLGLSFSLGAQTLVKDFVLGLFIILENQYRVGDTVEIKGVSGVVEQITLRSTIIRDNDGNVHYIPNGTIEQSSNKTKGFSKINMLVTVGGKTDVDKLAELINEVGERMAAEEKWKGKILEAPRFLNINNFSSKELEVKIVGKITPSAQWSVKGEFRKRLLVTFKKHGIEIDSTSTENPTK